MWEERVMLHKRRGFTLVELSLVIVVLAVQFAVLMPMVTKSKEDANKSTCQNNLKACANAYLMYITDWDGTLPSSGVANSNPDNAAVVKFLTAKGDPYPPETYGTGTTWPQILSFYLRDKSCIYCPSDTPQSRASYWWKYAADYAWRNLGARYEGAYGYAQNCVLLYEHAGWHTGDAAGAKDGVMINVAYMNGHVSTVTIRNGPTSYPLAADERTGASAIRLGEPMYYNYNYDTSTYHPGVADYTNPVSYGDKF